MRILMFGWELPPHNSGGLGVACQGLAQALSKGGDKVTFVLPQKIDVQSDMFDIVFADEHSSVGYINSLLSPYIRPEEYCALQQKYPSRFYSRSLFDEVYRYALLSRELAKTQSFDVIHAHDWLSLKAGVAAKEVSGKPLVFHVHATEFDRTGGMGVNQQVYAVEKEGIQQADAVVAVSNLTKDIIVRHYGEPETKIQVVYNGIDARAYKPIPLDKSLRALKRAGNHIVLFVGRITLQKGPDYFVQAAKKVAHYLSNTIFVVAGSGDMEAQIIEEGARLGISDKLLFAGFLRGRELQGVYQAADVLLMPSVSEPFGITALESLANKTPVIISRQSGASEALRHVLKVDFWDTDEMANKIVAVLTQPLLAHSLERNGKRNIARFTWSDAAEKCLKIYQGLVLQQAV